jgi:SH3 domain protein
MALKYVGLLVVLLSVTAAAETAFVTDNLRLGLHQAADTSDRSFRTLNSGQQVEILSRDRNYAHVRLPDGVQGYLKAAYLVFEKPAKLIVAETAARVLQLEEELATTKEAFAVPGATIASLEQELQQSRSELDTSNAMLEELTAANERYKARHDQFKYSLPLFWVVAAMATCLLFGFLTGVYWFDWKSRKRHGGIRVY